MIKSNLAVPAKVTYTGSQIGNRFKFFIRVDFSFRTVIPASPSDILAGHPWEGLTDGMVHG